MKVGICIATFRRPLLLEQLLESLCRLTFRKQTPVEVFLVVVDNDAAASAREVVEEIRARMPWPLIYAVEPTRNISLARNRGVELAMLENPDFLAFIDDDEVARPDWLDELLDVQQRYQADGVGGVVVPRYEAGVPQWILHGRFFKQPEFATGTRVTQVNTNNCLVSKRYVSDPLRRFDPAFGISGGGDSHFFMQAHRRGAKLVWAESAVVEEFIPSTRANSNWILKRAFRMGNAGVHCERAVLPAYRWLLPRTVKAALRILEGALLAGLSLLKGRTATMHALCKIANGTGSLAAIAGIRYYEYLVVHGK